MEDDTLTQNPNDKRQTMEVSRFHYYLNTVKCLPNVGLSALAVEIFQADKFQPVGKHFSENGHNVGDIVAYGIEEVFPKNDPLTIINREKLWIKRYGAIEHGNNRRL